MAAAKQSFAAAALLLKFTVKIVFHFRIYEIHVPAVYQGCRNPPCLSVVVIIGNKLSVSIQLRCVALKRNFRKPVIIRNTYLLKCQLSVSAETKLVSIFNLKRLTVRKADFSRLFIRININLIKAVSVPTLVGITARNRGADYTVRLVIITSIQAAAEPAHFCG